MIHSTTPYDNLIHTTRCNIFTFLNKHKAESLETKN